MNLIRAKLVIAMLGERPSQVIEGMRDELFEAIPEMVAMVGCTQNKYHAYDVWRHTMETLDACPMSMPVRMAALFHDIAKPASKGLNEATGEATFYDHDVMGAEVTQAILERLEYPAEEIGRIVHLVRHHFVRYEPTWSASTLNRWVRRVGHSCVNDLCDLARADIMGKGPARTELEIGVIDQLKHRFEMLGVPKEAPAFVLAVTGQDIMTHLGIGPGPAVGVILRGLLQIVEANPELNTREELLRRL